MRAMKKYFLLAAFLFTIIFTHKVHADTATLVPTGGADTSGTTTAALTATDVTKLAISDDSRIQSNGTWPAAGAYDESKYIEFTFTPNIPAGATVSSAIITHEFRRTGTLTAAKLEVWDGSAFTDEPLTTGTINTDHTDTADVSSLITTADKANAIKIRFLAYRSTAGNSQTSHDFIGIAITYAIGAAATPPPANILPTTADLALSTSAEASLVIVASGTDAENNPLTYSVVDAPTKGILGSFVGNRIIYSPNGPAGIDTFTYKANDGTSDSAISTVTITITPGVITQIVLSASGNIFSINEQAMLTATGEDRFGNVVTNDNTTSFYFYGSGQGALIQKDNWVPVFQGVATMPVSSSVSNKIIWFVSTAYLGSNAVETIFTPPPVLADPNDQGAHLHVVRVDGSFPSASPVSHTDQNTMFNLALSDNGRVSPLGPWPQNASAFDEDTFMEYDLSSAQIPDEAIIDSVFLTNKYSYVSYSTSSSTSASLAAAKFEIWNGVRFVDMPTGLPASSVNDRSQTFDITPFINSAAKANKIQIRFLAYGAGPTQIGTTHDLVGVDVGYHLGGPALSLAPPVASSQSLVATVGTPVHIELLGSDPDNGTFSYSIVSSPSLGTLSALSGNRISYAPTAQSGSDEFTFKVNNGKQDSPPAMISFTITGGTDTTDTSDSSSEITATEGTGSTGETVDTGTTSGDTSDSVADTPAGDAPSTETHSSSGGGGGGEAIFLPTQAPQQTHVPDPVAPRAEVAVAQPAQEPASTEIVSEMPEQPEPAKTITPTETPSLELAGNAIGAGVMIKDSGIFIVGLICGILFSTFIRRLITSKRT